jgi:hypothetical protein
MVGAYLPVGIGRTPTDFINTPPALFADNNPLQNLNATNLVALDTIDRELGYLSRKS